MGVIALAMRECSKLKEFGVIREAREVLKIVGGDVVEKVKFAMEELVKKGVKLGARDGGACSVVDGGERKVLVTLDEDRGGGAVRPEFHGVGWRDGGGVMVTTSFWSRACEGGSWVPGGRGKEY